MSNVKAKKVFMHSEVDGSEHTIVHRLCENGPSTVGELLPVFLASFHQKYGRHVGPSLEVVSQAGKGYAPQTPLAALRPGTDLFVQRGEFVASEQAAVESSSKLKANMAEKKENSYYYAHYATPDAPVPEPKRLATHAAVVDNVVTLQNYMLEDGDTKVKVHIPIKDLASMPKDSVVVHFREQSFDLRVYGSLDGKVYALNVGILNEKIVKEDCKVSKKKEKLIVTLKKQPGGHTWDSMHKTWGLNEPRDSIVPNGGEPRTLML